MPVDPEELSRRLRATFVAELEEHLAALNRDLLALEKERDDQVRPELLHSIFRTLHTIKGSSRAAGFGAIEQTSHHMEDRISQLREGKLSLSPALFDAFFALSDALALSSDLLRRGRPLDEEVLAAAAARVQSIEAAPAPGEPAPASVAAPRSEVPRSAGPPSDVASTRGPASAAPASHAPASHAPSSHAPASVSATGAPAERASGAPGVGGGTLRVGAELVDELVAWSNEMLVAQQRIEGSLRLLDELAQEGSEALREVATRQQRDGRRMRQVAERLDGAIRRLRVSPFREACQGLERAVRDVAQATGKQAELRVEGEDVELDRSLIEGLREPLLHLVRNAVDHGLESPEERRRQGKLVVGRVVVRAVVRGADVMVTVEDDGHGLDLARLRKLAQSRGLADAVRAEELAWLIFQPGVSTAPSVTHLSGRGVGLDVVKRRVEAMHGTIDVSSEPGRGMRFWMVMPLSLSLLRVLMVRVGEQWYAIPTSTVRTLLRAERSQVVAVGGSQVLLHEGQSLPLIWLGALLGQGLQDDRERVAVVVLAAQGSQVACVVDELIEEEEATVKSLGPRLRGVRGLVGATILPTGRVVMMLDGSSLVSQGKAEQMQARPVATSGSRRRFHVLLADDSITTRVLEKTILEGAGYDVTAAADGAEAWRLLQEQSFDAVVTDVEMPNLTGLELTERIRASPSFQRLPVVIVTGLARPEERARGLEVGATAYLVKSAFDQRELLEVLEQHLG